MLVCSVFDSNYRFIQNENNLILNIMNKYYKRYRYNKRRKKEVLFYFDILRFDDEARDE